MNRSSVFRSSTARAGAIETATKGSGIRSRPKTLVHSSGSTSPISTRIFNAGSLDHAASDFGLLGRYRPPNQHPLPHYRRLLDLHRSGASKWLPVFGKDHAQLKR